MKEYDRTKHTICCLCGKVITWFEALENGKCDECKPLETEYD